MGAVTQVMELVITLVMGLSTPVKMAWIAWLLWAAAQVLWFRRSPAPQPALSLSIQPSRPRPREVPPKRKSSPSLPVAPYGMSDFAAALENEQQHRAATAHDTES
jgi:hypothetical protein